MTFDLSEIHKKFMQNKPNFYLYLGSMTTPPCTEYVYHLVMDKPLLLPPCQYKLLRENSLITSRAKEIHARLPKPLNDVPPAQLPRFKSVLSSSKIIIPVNAAQLGERNVYLFTNDKIKVLNSFTDILPMSYNKYLVAHGLGARTLAKWAALAKKHGPKSKWAKKLHRYLLLQATKRRALFKARLNGAKGKGKGGINDFLYGSDEFDDMDCTMPAEAA